MSTLILLGYPLNGLGLEPQATQALQLTHADRPACSIVALSKGEPPLLTRRAVEVIRETVSRWSSVNLPVIHLTEDTRQLPSGPAIVLGVIDQLRRLVPDSENHSRELNQVPFLDEHGFACAPVELNGSRCILVASRSPRGVYNGAQYLRDFAIDGSREQLSIAVSPVIRSPHLPGRAAYTLTIWNHEARYTAADWEKIFDSFARDGLERVYFWVSGHFPSKKFPQTYRCVDGPWDTTKESRIGSVEDLRRLVRYAHELGLKFYLGGGLGGWCGTYFLTDLQPDTLKTGPAEAKYSLCPSHPKVRQSLIAYWKELFDALPEADGVYIESADEMGPCQCQVCHHPVDNLGSRQFGQSQLSLLQEIMSAIWTNHPHARCSYTIGYAEHQQDPAYYQVVRQMSDPRIEWMEARDRWSLPGPDGQDLPAAYFSRQIMHWQIYDSQPLEVLINDLNRVARSGFYGLIMSFSPGFDSGSFYKDIPFPTGLLPYVLTYFVYREGTWEPALTAQQMRQRVQSRFFGAESPAQLVDDLWSLREQIRIVAKSRLTADRISATASRLDDIERHLRQARHGASPKTLETLDMMDRAMADTRAHLRNSTNTGTAPNN